VSQMAPRNRPGYKLRSRERSWSRRGREMRGKADRSYLLAVAAGMLGRPTEAEDMVQEAFARLPPDGCGSRPGWTSSRPG
jgi:hypothetical protein